MSEVEKFAEIKEEYTESCHTCSTLPSNKLQIKPDQMADDFKEEVSEGPLVFDNDVDSAEEFGSSAPKPIGPMLETPSTAGPCCASDNLSGINVENRPNIVTLESDPLSETGNDAPDRNHSDVFHASKGFKNVRSNEHYTMIMTEDDQTNQDAQLANNVQNNREAAKEVPLTLTYTSPMTSPVDVLTPINISYSTEGVPPPLLVKCEEEEDFKTDIKHFKCEHIRLVFNQCIFVFSIIFYFYAITDMFCSEIATFTILAGLII